MGESKLKESTDTLKLVIKGEDIKEMVNNGDNVIINKVDGSNHTITNNLNVIMFNDSQKIEDVDKLLRTLGASIPSGRGLMLKTSNETNNYESKIKDYLERPIKMKIEEQEIVEKSIISRDVIVKKPDLEMKSKWQIYIHNKLYEVDIIDEEFKKYVTSKRFMAYNGMKLRVDIEEEVRYDIKNDEKVLEKIDYKNIVKVYLDTETMTLF